MVGNHLLQLIRRNAIQVLVTPPAIPVGKIKSFGALGPKYEVGHALRQLEDGDWMVEVTLVESGEKVEYRWTRLSDDPEAH
ncbi:hypothetical protein Metme_0028 [Methylomonas methanica MC09]|uniref:Uncharacterized protein n=2 Tax=Methylomonas methanica TaxID=421 RepID=F9ZX22_METMM|nr:hypothetical protein Metme_0028 [Methylomonas methanica MC09]